MVQSDNCVISNINYFEWRYYCLIIIIVTKEGEVIFQPELTLAHTLANYVPRYALLLIFTNAFLLILILLGVISIRFLLTHSIINS